MEVHYNNLGTKKSLFTVGLCQWGQRLVFPPAEECPECRRGGENRRRERASRFFSLHSSLGSSSFIHSSPMHLLLRGSAAGPAHLFSHRLRNPIPFRPNPTLLQRKGGEGRIVGGGGGNVPHNYCSHFSPLPLARKHLLHKNSKLFSLSPPQRTTRFRLPKVCRRRRVDAKSGVGKRRGRYRPEM